jgi:hypothetical protein
MEGATRKLICLLVPLSPPTTEMNTRHLAPDPKITVNKDQDIVQEPLPTNSNCIYKNPSTDSEQHTQRTSSLPPKTSEHEVPNSKHQPTDINFQNLLNQELSAAKRLDRVKQSNSALDITQKREKKVSLENQFTSFLEYNSRPKFISSLYHDTKSSLKITSVLGKISNPGVIGNFYHDKTHSIETTPTPGDLPRPGAISNFQYNTSTSIEFTPISKPIPSPQATRNLHYNIPRNDCPVCFPFLSVASYTNINLLKQQLNILKATDTHEIALGNKSLSPCQLIPRRGFIGCLHYNITDSESLQSLSPSTTKVCLHFSLLCSSTL